MYQGAIALFLVSAAVGIMAADVPVDVPWEARARAAVCPCQATPNARLATIEDTYLGLSQGPLRFACLEALPKGVLLRAGTVTISEQQLAAEIAGANTDMQPIMKKNSFLILEQMATRQLLTAEARAWATNTKRDTKQDTDATLMQAYLASIARQTTVTDDEVKAFYDANKALLGGASYDAVANEMKTYLREQKQQDTVDAYVNALSTRTPVVVDRDWLNGQATTILDNPVDQARRSGKPSVIDFGREGCGPCDMMTPILAELQKTYTGQCNVLFCHVGENPILASRYNVQTIPTQVFFDKEGKEVFRHVGFFPKEQMLAKMAELGVK